MHLLCALFSVSLCAVTTAATGVLDSQQPLSLSNDAPVLNSRLDNAILDILKETKTPGGIGIAVVRKTAQGTWQLESKGYGNATAHGAKVTADTLFAIGSNSKVCPA
jgi:CubicO group peptidase (beta-lactamase class C family)